MLHITIKVHSQHRLKKKFCTNENGMRPVLLSDCELLRIGRKLWKVGTKRRPIRSFGSEERTTKICCNLCACSLSEFFFFFFFFWGGGGVFIFGSTKSIWSRPVICYLVALSGECPDYTEPPTIQGYNFDCTSPPPSHLRLFCFTWPSQVRSG